MILHRNEKELVRILFRESRAMAVQSIAKYAGMSWVTARKYLDELCKKAVAVKHGSRYMLNAEVLKALARRGQ